MPTRNISLTERFDGFVEQNVRAGQFANASEVVRAGLHLLEQRQRDDALRVERLRAAAEVGFGALDMDDYVEVEGEHGLREHLALIGRAARERVAPVDG